MKPEYVTAEIWLMIDENGDYVVSLEESELDNVYEGDLGNCVVRSVVRVQVRAPIPQALSAVAEVKMPEPGDDVTASAEAIP
jgi:hypothetical protein